MTVSPVDTRDLLGRAREGDRDAFGVLYDRYHQYVLTYLMSMGTTYEESWDLMQETFLHAWRGLHTLNLQADVQFGGWLRRTAHNVLLKRLRRQSKARLVSASAENFPEIPDVDAARPEDQVARSADYTALLHCMERLGVELRRIVISKFVYGLSGREIAEKLGLAEGSVRNRLREAYDTLRECLEGKGIDLAR